MDDRRHRHRFAETGEKRRSQRFCSKLESWAEAINRVTAASLLDETRQKVRDTFAAFLGPALESHIPFAATYGNHDFQCGILADEQDDLYREFAGCMNPVAGSSPLALEPGTFALPIEASDGSGRITMSVMMVNSGDYADTADAGDGNGRQSVTEYAKYAANSRGWDLADSDGYRHPLAGSRRMAEARATRVGQAQWRRAGGTGDRLPAHSAAGILRLPARSARLHAERRGGRARIRRTLLCARRDVCRPGSRLGEAIGCADVNVGEVDALREAGGYFALFCGHDHKNSFVGHVHDIDLGYAPTCGFECYGPKSRFRGIRLFEFREDNPMAYVTRMLTWGDLVGRYSSNELRVFFEDHCVTDLIGVRNELRRPQVSATLLGAGAVTCGAIGYAVRGLLRNRSNAMLVAIAMIDSDSAAAPPTTRPYRISLKIFRLEEGVLL